MILTTTAAQVKLGTLQTKTALVTLRLNAAQMTTMETIQIIVPVTLKFTAASLILGLQIQTAIVIQTSTAVQINITLTILNIVFAMTLLYVANLQTHGETMFSVLATVKKIVALVMVIILILTRKIALATPNFNAVQRIIAQPTTDANVTQNSVAAVETLILTTPEIAIVNPQMDAAQEIHSHKTNNALATLQSCVALLMSTLATQKMIMNFVVIQLNNVAQVIHI